MARITTKYLINWINEKFKQLEINDYEVFEIVRTHFTSDQYESGAAYLIIRFRFIEDHSASGYFLCFYPIYQIQDHLNHGFELFLDFNKGRYTAASLSDIQLNLRRV